MGRQVILTREVLLHAIRHGWPVEEVCRRYRVTTAPVYRAEKRFGLKLPKRKTGLCSQIM